MLSPHSFEVKLQKACGIDMRKDIIKACYFVEGQPVGFRDYGTNKTEHSTGLSTAYWPTTKQSMLF